MPRKTADMRSIVSLYTERHDLYADYSTIVASIIKSILENEDIPYQVISNRAKTIESLREKIKRKRVQGTVYNKLDDVTDLAGVRVILYFKDDVETVLSIIDEEFSIVAKKTEQPKLQLEHGYTAYHRIVKLKQKRTNLKEYARYKGLLAEVQIKTVLQHAWSEIEHDIGYKPRVYEVDLKRENIRKHFVQNAKLLEEVDNKFVKIRTLHEKILKEYQDDIDKKNLAIPVNYDTVSTYLKKRCKGKYIRKQEVLDILVQAEKKGLGNLNELSDALDSKTIEFSYDD